MIRLLFGCFMTVEFSQKTQAKLDELTERLDTTKAGVLRYGIAAVEKFLKAEEEGAALAVVKDGRILYLLVPLLAA